MYLMLMLEVIIIKIIELDSGWKQILQSIGF